MSFNFSVSKANDILLTPFNSFKSYGRFKSST